MDKLIIPELTRAELEQEYELSQWALTWAILKAGGKIDITKADMEELSRTGRLYYSTDPLTRTTTVEFREVSELIVSSRINYGDRK